MAEAYSSTRFDQLSVGQPPPISSPYKTKTAMNSAMMSDDWRWVTSGKDVGQWRALTGDHITRTPVARRRRRQDTSTSAENTGFVGLMQQLAVDGQELFELAELGHFDVVDSTAEKDDNGGPVTFTSPESYLSLSFTSQSSTFSIYFRVPFLAHCLYLFWLYVLNV